MTKFFNQSPLLSASLTLSAISTVFGVWFKAKQLSVASDELLNFYPWSGFALCIVQIGVIFFTFALGLAAIGSWIDRDQSLTKKDIFFCTLPFCAFLFSAFDISFFYQLILFFLGVGFYLFFKIHNNRWFLLRVKEPLVVLLLFFVLFSWIYETVSPFYEQNFLSIPGKLDAFLSMEHQWENAKAYDFVGNFSQNYRLGGFSQGLFVVSPLLSFFALALDTPLVDVYSKYDLVKYFLFFLCFGSSYGCYLFLRFGLKLSITPSIIGGFSYILANSPLLSFIANEYVYKIVPFALLPWVMLCISQAYAKSRLEWIFLSGLVIGFSQYIWTSHPEAVALPVGFSFAYICWMAIGKLFSKRIRWTNIVRFTLEIALFPFAVFVGMAYFLIPLFEAIFLMEYLVVDSSSTMGFFWGGAIEHYASIFFRFEDMNLYKFAPGLYQATAGPIVGFYTGQFSLFMVFFLLCRFLIFLYQKCLQRASSKNYKIKGSELFFLILVVFCCLTFPMGHAGWFSKLIEWTGFLRVHNFLRANMYFFFIALVAAMIGLNYLLKLKSIKTFFIIALAYILLLTGVYFSPLFPERIPDRILLDIGIFVATLVFFVFLFLCPDRIKKNSYLSRYSFQSFINLEKLAMGLIICLGIFSYYTVYPLTRDYLTRADNYYFDKARNFNSFRSAVVILRANRHDKASYDSLDKRVENFERLFESSRNTRMINQTAQYMHSLRSDSEIVKSQIAKDELIKYEKEILNLLKQRYTPIIEFKDFLDGQLREGQVSSGTYEQAIKYLNLGDRELAYFEVAAPVIDNFYLRDDNHFTIATQAVAPFRLAPLQHLTYGSFQYYLSDKYHFFINISKALNGLLNPIGKNHQFNGPQFYVTGGSYPSKNITFHLRAIFKNAHSVIRYNMPSVIPEAVEMSDFHIKNLNAKFIRPDSEIRKLLNIYGVDFVSFSQHYLSQKMNPDENSQVLEDLRSQGFIEFEFPKSYRSHVKFGKQAKWNVFTNPQSYGRAYVARWVKFVRPEDNLANEGILSLGITWPGSKKLTKNFETHMSSVPENIWRSIIIEPFDLKDMQEVPQVFEGDSRVDIKKIIASKAVFDVDCQDENCWFVYNTTVLNGWKAYSGSEQLSINKANLGFVGLKLKKGKQLVWLEYAPPSLAIGLLVTLLGWFFIFWSVLKPKLTPYHNQLI
jgi:hypothetical protein